MCVSQRAKYPYSPRYQGSQALRDYRCPEDEGDPAAHSRREPDYFSRANIATKVTRVAIAAPITDGTSILSPASNGSSTKITAQAIATTIDASAACFKAGAPLAAGRSISDRQRPHPLPTGLLRATNSSHWMPATPSPHRDGDRRAQPERRAARNSRVASVASCGKSPCLPGCTCIRLSRDPIASNSSSAPARSKISSSH